MTILNLKGLLSQYQATQENPLQFRKIRSELIHLVGEIYAKKKMTDGGLNKKYYQQGLCDGFLKKAEYLHNEWTHCPAAFNRLKPLADEYLQAWSVIFQALAQYNATGVETPLLIEQIELFVQKHLKFSHQYAEELKMHACDSHLGTQLNYPMTLKLFYCYIGRFLAEQPQFGNQLKQLLENADEKAILLIPHLCILQGFKFQNGTYTELLEDFAEELDLLRIAYMKLNSLDQILLEMALFDDQCQLNENLKTIHLALNRISYRLQSENLAQPFSRCLHTLITELQEDFLLAEQFKSELSSLKTIPPNSSGAIYALLHLSNQSLELLQRFLPTLGELKKFQIQFQNSASSFQADVQMFLYGAKRIDSNPAYMGIVNVENDLLNEPKLYRLFGILQQVFMPK